MDTYEFNLTPSASRLMLKDSIIKSAILQAKINGARKTNILLAGHILVTVYNPDLVTNKTFKREYRKAIT